jgi:hypothetical protein
MFRLPGAPACQNDYYQRGGSRSIAYGLATRGAAHLRRVGIFLQTHITSSFSSETCLAFTWKNTANYPVNLLE